MMANIFVVKSSVISYQTTKHVMSMVQYVTIANIFISRKIGTMQRDLEIRCMPVLMRTLQTAQCRLHFCHQSARPGCSCLLHMHICACRVIFEEKRLTFIEDNWNIIQVAISLIKVIPVNLDNYLWRKR